MAIWEKDNFVTLIGFLLVLAVGINIVLFFGDNLNVGNAPLTGFAATNCANTFEGVKCGSILFPLREQAGSCGGSETAICTNSCQIEKALSNDNRECPSECSLVCVPDALATKL